MDLDVRCMAQMEEVGCFVLAALRAHQDVVHVAGWAGTVRVVDLTEPAGTLQHFSANLGRDDTLGGRFAFHGRTTQR
jgi:hypothetical protein